MINSSINHKYMERKGMTNWTGETKKQEKKTAVINSFCFAIFKLWMQDRQQRDRTFHLNLNKRYSKEIGAESSLVL